MADEARELAKRIVRLEKAQAALGRSRQIARSTVDIDVDGVQVSTPVPEALSKGVAARVVADAAAAEARAAKDDAVQALADATAALEGIDTLETDLTADITAAQAAADQAVQDAAAAQVTADGKNRVTASQAEPSYASPVQGDVWYVLDTEDRVVGVRVWDGTAWAPYTLVADQVLVPGSVGNVAIGDGEVTAPKLTASEELSAKVAQFLEVKASQLVADTAAMNSAFIDQLVGQDAFLASLYTNRAIVDPTDYAPGPLGYESAWLVPSTGLIGASGVDPARGALYINCNNGGYLDRHIFGPLVPVTPGQTIGIEAVIGPWKAGQDGRAQVLVYWSENGENIDPSSWSAPFSWPNPGESGRYSGTVTVPAGKTHARFAVGCDSSTTGGWYFRELTVRPQVGPVLIQNGAVTADKLAAGSVDADKIAAGSITADQIDAEGLSVRNLHVGSFAQSFAPPLVAGGAWSSTTQSLSYFSENGEPAVHVVAPASGDSWNGGFGTNITLDSTDPTTQPGEGVIVRLRFQIRIPEAQPGTRLIHVQLKARRQAAANQWETLKTESIPRNNEWVQVEATVSATMLGDLDSTNRFRGVEVRIAPPLLTPNYDYDIKSIEIQKSETYTFMDDTRATLGALTVGNVLAANLDLNPGGSVRASYLRADGNIVIGPSGNSVTLTKSRVEQAFARAAGAVSITTPPAGDVASVQVTLPAGRFTDTPSANVTHRSIVPGVCMVSTGSVTSSSFVIYLKNVSSSASSTAVDWIVTARG